MPELIAAHLGVRRYVAPMIAEGGSFFTDGAGTLLTTDQCLLWLAEGHYHDFATDGHVDDIAHFLGPGRVIVHAPSNPAHRDHGKGAANVAQIRAMADAEAVRFDTGAADGLPYLNFYVGNGGVVATARAEVLFHCGGGGPTASPNRCPRGRSPHLRGSKVAAASVVLPGCRPLTSTPSSS